MKKKSCLHKYKNRADCMNGNVHVFVLWPGSTKKMDNYILFFLIFWWWFAVVCGGLPASSLVVLPMSQIPSDLWWFAVMCGGFFFLWWFAVVCGDLR